MKWRPNEEEEGGASIDQPVKRHACWVIRPESSVPAALVIKNNRIEGAGQEAKRSDKKNVLQPANALDHSRYFQRVSREPRPSSKQTREEKVHAAISKISAPQQADQ